MESELITAEATNPLYSKEEVAIEAIIQGLVSKIEGLQTQINAILDVDVNSKLYENESSEIERFIGRVEQYIETHNKHKESEISDKIKELKEEKQKQKELYSERLVKENLLGISKKLTANIAKIIPLLDAEDKNALVELDTEELTLNKASFPPQFTLVKYPLVVD
jgi:seryl-tRNA synthetase